MFLGAPGFWNEEGRPRREVAEEGGGWRRRQVLRTRELEERGLAGWDAGQLGVAVMGPGLGREGSKRRGGCLPAVHSQTWPGDVGQPGHPGTSSQHPFCILARVGRATSSSGICVNTFMGCSSHALGFPLQAVQPGVPRARGQVPTRQLQDIFITLRKTTPRPLAATWRPPANHNRAGLCWGGSAQSPESALRWSLCCHALEI